MRKGATIVAGLLWAVSVIGCLIGALTDYEAFLRAWLCSYLFWLGVPLGGVTLILVHDLSGGAWMAVARPALVAATLTMPLASLAGVPAFLDLKALYTWAGASQPPSNAFYLNATDFLIRYGAYLLIWNLLAAFAVFAPRFGGRPIAPGLSWISGLGLVALAFSTGFAAIDWILSLEPKFWSGIFPYIQSSSWFNTGMALVVLMVAITSGARNDRLASLADLARLLLATTIFWAYVEFIQFLIIWEENLRDEIPWYIKRLHSPWQAAAYVASIFGFFVPFFTLLWTPPKRSRFVIVAVCALILISRIAYVWWLVLPEFSAPTHFWLDTATLLTLGGAIAALFGLGLRYGSSLARRSQQTLSPEHG